MPKNDIKIKKLLAIIAVQKQALGTRPRTNYKTNALFKFDDGQHLNLNVAQEMQIIDAMAYLMHKITAHKAACSLLDIEISEPVYSGASLDVWTADFKARLAVIKWEFNAKKLESTHAQLSALISEDVKTEIALDEIEKMLK